MPLVRPKLRFDSQWTCCPKLLSRVVLLVTHRNRRSVALRRTTVLRRPALGSSQPTQTQGGVPQATEAGPSLCCVKALGAVYKIALEEKKRKKPPDDRRHQKSGFPVGMYTGPYFESPAQTHGKFSLFHSLFGDIAHDAPRRINSTLSGLIRRDSNPETPSSSQAVASRLGCHAHKSETQPGTASPAVVYYPR